MTYPYVTELLRELRSQVAALLQRVDDTIAMLDRDAAFPFTRMEGSPATVNLDDPQPSQEC